MALLRTGKLRLSKKTARDKPLPYRCEMRCDWEVKVYALLDWQVPFGWLRAGRTGKP